MSLVEQARSRIEKARATIRGGGGQLLGQGGLGLLSEGGLLGQSMLLGTRRVTLQEVRSKGAVAVLRETFPKLGTLGGGAGVGAGLATTFPKLAEIRTRGIIPTISRRPTLFRRDITDLSIESGMSIAEKGAKPADRRDMAIEL